jgi:fatty acid desaturase
MSSPQARRRQRSTRLTVAVVLIVASALAVAGAVLSGSWLFVTTAAVLGVVLGASATRITHSELLQARRDAARDRATQARDYRDLTEVRTAEHAEFAASMTSRL